MCLLLVRLGRRQLIVERLEKISEPQNRTLGMGPVRPHSELPSTSDGRDI